MKRRAVLTSLAAAAAALSLPVVAKEALPPGGLRGATGVLLVRSLFPGWIR